MGNIEAITNISSNRQVSQVRNIQDVGQAQGPSFRDTLSGFLNDVNSMHLQSDEKIQRMLAGEVTDVHQVMLAADEARTAFNMMMEIRNRAMTAYDEVMRMRL